MSTSEVRAKYIHSPTTYLHSYAEPIRSTQAMSSGNNKTQASSTKKNKTQATPSENNNSMYWSPLKNRSCRLDAFPCLGDPSKQYRMLLNTIEQRGDATFDFEVRIQLIDFSEKNYC